MVIYSHLKAIEVHYKTFEYWYLLWKQKSTTYYVKQFIYKNSEITQAMLKNMLLACLLILAKKGKT